MSGGQRWLRQEESHKEFFFLSVLQPLDFTLSLLIQQATQRLWRFALLVKFSYLE